MKEMLQKCGCRYFINCLLGLFLCASISCAPKNKKGPSGEPVTPQYEKGNYYSESGLQDLIAKVSDELGVVVSVNDQKDFLNENSYKRVLMMLSKRREEIKTSLDGVVKIVIAKDFQVSQYQEDYILTVDRDSDEKTLVEFFARNFVDYRRNNIVYLNSTRFSPTTFQIGSKF